MTATVRARIVLSTLATSLLLAGASCGGGAAAARGGGSLPVVVPVRELDAASDAPHVSHVRDLGPPVPLPNGALAHARSDGKFTIGEYVLVEGDDFGKLPTVLIGGRPARVLARTEGGGIVTQIPTGVTGGATTVEVSHPAGRHQVSIDVTRYAIVLDAVSGAVHFLAIAGADAHPVTSFKMQRPERVRFSADGAWAYLVSPSFDSKGDPKNPDVGQVAVLSTIALTAEGGPAVVHSTRVPAGPTVALALAGKLLVLVDGSSLHVFALDEPETTAPYNRFPLAPDIAAVGPVAADLSPDGQRLALLTANNAVTFYSLANPGTPEQLATVPLLPGKRLPLVRDLRFDAAGTLWIVAGDSQKSLAVGHSSTQLIRIDAAAGAAPRAVDVAGAGPPLAVTPAPRESLKSATTIGDTAGDLPIFVTSIDQKLMAAPTTTASTGAIVASLAEPGQVVRTDSAGRGGPLKALPGVVAGVIALTPDATLLLATAWSFVGGGDAARFGVWISGVGADAAPRFVELSGGAPAGYLPQTLGDIAIQP